MIRWKHVFAALAVAASTNNVGVGDGVRLGGNGLLVDMAAPVSSPSVAYPIATSDCVVRVNQRQVVLHWTTSSFQHLQHPEYQSDAAISAVLTSSIGQVAVSPQHIVNRTNLAKHQNQAGVAMSIAGNGQAKIKLSIKLEDDAPVAGVHCATVVLTVTGN